MVKEADFQQLVEWSNLYLAWQKASKGKRSSIAVAVFESRLEDNLFELQESLSQKIWRPGEYVNFYIHDPKLRLISAAPFADRVVHHALCNIIEPAFERSFVKESFANRVGKGNHRAIDHAQYCARHFNYVLPLDIQKFFPSIDHQILIELLAKKIQDEDIMALIAVIIASGLDCGQTPNASSLISGDEPRPKGLPIGNLTSQFWANVYLNPLDHFIKRSLRCKAYVRYVDDLSDIPHPC